jgi:hypothetical protein
MHGENCRKFLATSDARNTHCGGHNDTYADWFHAVRRRTTKLVWGVKFIMMSNNQRTIIDLSKITNPSRLNNSKKPAQMSSAVL